MDVVRTNFISLLPKILENIEKCDFVAIDGEFSGLGQFRNFNLLDTLEERYTKMRESCLDYSLIQFGLSCFHKVTNDEVDYHCESYNFYIFPYKVTGAPKLGEKSFLFQASSFQFLASHGFDFNKWVNEGISYLNVDEEAKLIEAIKGRNGQADGAVDGENDTSIVDSEARREPGTPFKNTNHVPNEHKDFIDAFMNDLTSFVDDDSRVKWDLEPCSAYRRKLIFQSVKSLHLDALKLTSCPVSVNTSERYISIEKVSSEEKDLAEKNLIAEAVGFSRVIQELSKSRKPIVGHNFLIDIIHIIVHFIGHLPEDLNEFKEMIRELFPFSYDTKFMATDPKFKDLLQYTSLNDLHTVVQKAPFANLKAKIVNREENGVDPSFHQAGYDSFVTGIIFINLVKHLYPKEKNLPFNSSSLLNFQGKYNLTYSTDLLFLDVTAKQPMPNRDNVFYLTFPTKWKQNDIHQLFSPYGPIQISWIDDSSAFILVKNFDQVKNVETGLILNNKSSIFSLKTFKHYKSQSTAFGFKSEKRKRDSLDDRDTKNDDENVNDNGADNDTGNDKSNIKECSPTTENVKRIKVDVGGSSGREIFEPNNNW